MDPEYPLAVVIDDDARSLDALETCLESRGFVVVTFAEAGEFFRLVPSTAFRPSLAIIAGCGPERPTYPAMADEYHRCAQAFPIVVLTGPETPVPHERAPAGCHFLSKPVHPAILDALIDTVVDRGGGHRHRTA